MSNYDQPGSLDGAIDDAVREMMEVDPRPGLRHRVAGAIGARSQREGGFRVGLAWAAALTIVVIASALLLRSPEPAPPVITPQVAEAPPAAPALPQAGPQAVEAARRPASGAARRREPAPETIFGPRMDRVAAASIPMEAPVPADPEPAAGRVPALPPVLAPALAPLAPIHVDPIELTPLTLEPLAVSAISHRR